MIFKLQVYLTCSTYLCSESSCDMVAALQRIGLTDVDTIIKVCQKEFT